MKRSIKFLCLAMFLLIFSAFDSVYEASVVELQKLDETTYDVSFSEPFGINYSATINGTSVIGGSVVSVSSGANVDVVVNFIGASCSDADEFSLAATDAAFNILDCYDEDCSNFGTFSISFTMPSEEVDVFMVATLCSSI